MKPKRREEPADTAQPGGAHLTSQEAAEMLRIKPQTLYAYVSRGLIRRVHSDSQRGFLYLREDAERLASRGRSRAESGPPKNAAPHWSQPVVQTSITEITPKGPSYRGHPAIELARNGERFENVAEMIWTGVLSDEALIWEPVHPTWLHEALLHPPKPGSAALLADLQRHFSLLLAALAAGDTGVDDIRDGTTIRCSRQVLRTLVGCLGHLLPANRFVVAQAGESIAGQMARILADGKEASAEAINSALVLLADHQLTPQTVAVRLAASSGASLFHCLNCALSVHSSSRTRRACDRIEDLLLDCDDDSEKFSRQLERLRHLAGTAPGFDHPLYPGGDPRALPLIEMAERLLASGHGSHRLADHVAQVQARSGIRPAVETGLVLLCHAMEMPRRSASALLTIARFAGWIGHVIEQRTAGLMLRPRNRYRG